MASPDDLSAVNADPFSEIISNFHKIFDSRDALTFLIGAGCSKCAGLPLTGKLINEVLASDKLDCDSKSILGEVEKTFSESVDAHIEDYLSEIIDFLAITDRRSERGARQNTIMVGDNLYKAEQLRAAANQIKQAIAGIIERESDISNHRDFVTSVHRPARVGRPPPSQPVDYLVLNYDTIIEDALALGKIPYADGIDGGATGWWNSCTFDLEHCTHVSSSSMDQLTGTNSQMNLYQGESVGISKCKVMKTTGFSFGLHQLSIERHS